MIESEEKATNIQAQKAKIRERYKGVSKDVLDVIPAHPQASLYEETTEKRVAVYARVSTDDPRQTSSYELQKNHYHDVVARHCGWRLYDIYADEGISGTSLQHRDAFIRMIQDCKNHKIDLIVTKSVSRFARNVLDCIGYVRQLRAMNPPVGVFFETENIYTLDNNSEMSLSFISTLAQEESHNKSEIMNASIEMRFVRGIFLTPPLLGYDQDEDGNLVVNENEADIVRLIFFLYLDGCTCQKIARKLTDLGCKTKRDNQTWSASTVLQILTNERHCGDVLARKTWTPNYLDHKAKKNNQDRNQYRQRDHHEAIVSRADFIAVQKMLSNAKYHNKSILPELQVIKNGALKGFVIVNPRWAGFSVNDYKLASESVFEEAIQSQNKPLDVEANTGDFDMRGFEIARSQFFSNSNRNFITISIDNFQFSITAIRKLDNTAYVELLLQPNQRTLAARVSSKDNRQAVQWAKLTEDGIKTRTVRGAAFLPRIFELMNWNPKYKYRIQGVRHQKEDEAYLEFPLSETEVFLPLDVSAYAQQESDVVDGDLEQATKRRMVRLHAFPADWAKGFGTEYYSHAAQDAACSEIDNWNIQSDPVPFSDGEKLDVSSSKTISENIHQIVTKLSQEEEHGE